MDFWCGGLVGEFMRGGCGGMWFEVAAHALQLRSLLSNFRGTMRAKIFISMLALLVALGAVAPAVAVEKSALQQLQQKVLQDYERERERERQREVQREKERAVFGGKTEAEYFARIPAGSFRMGDIQGDGSKYAKPVRSVSIKTFLMGQTEVTVGEFTAFVSDTGYVTEAEQSRGCRYRQGSWQWGSSMNWRRPYQMNQSYKDPVNCISWNDVNRYIRWIYVKTGKRYRLPSEAEWEYAARAGSETKYFFGDSLSDLCKYANGAAREAGFRWQNRACNDGYPKTAPVASLKENSFGLYDMHGNISEWTQDCWNGSYRGAPSDGSAWLTGNCGRRVFRGGHWMSARNNLRSSSRFDRKVGYNSYYLGFRLARTLQ